MTRRFRFSPHAVAVLLTLCVAAPSYADVGQGGFGGLDLGFAEGNFSIDDADSSADVGDIFSLFGGYRLRSGLGLSLGLSEAYYAYAREVDRDRLSFEFALSMLDLSAWYFVPLGRRWEGHVRGGLGLTSAQAGNGLITSSQDSNGLVLSGGVAVRLVGGFALYTELHFRTYGVRFNSFDVDDELRTTGLSAGVGWRPEGRRGYIRTDITR